MLLNALVFILTRKSRKIKLAEVLVWSWKEFLSYGLRNAFLFGLPFGLIIDFFSGLRNGLFSWLFSGLFFGLAAGLHMGFTGSQITEHLRIQTNQGIRNSGLNALYVGFISMLLFGPLIGLLTGLFFGLLTGLFFGLLTGLFFGFTVGLVYGGEAYLKHYIFCYLLWRSGVMPYHFVHFLEEASERILLQKVGGGYRFIHPLFLDYFASQPLIISPTNTQQPIILTSPYSLRSGSFSSTETQSEYTGITDAHC